MSKSPSLQFSVCLVRVFLCVCAQFSPQDVCLPVVVTGLKGVGCTQGELEQKDNVRSLKYSENKLIQYMLARCNLHM